MHSSQPAGSADVRSSRTGSTTVPMRDLEATLADGPFHTALHLAIEQSELSMERIQSMLADGGIRISLTTLSYWRHGRSRPERSESLRAVRALEEILALPSGGLRRLLGPRRRRGRCLDQPDHTIDPTPLYPQDSSAVTLMQQLRGLESAAVSEVCMHHVVRVGPGGEQLSVDVTRVLRAIGERVHRVYELWSEEYEGEPELTVTALSGMRVGRVRRDDPEASRVSELVLDRPLASGETAMLRYRLLFTGPTAEPFFERKLHKGSGSYLLQLQFDPLALPSRCQSYYKREPGEPASELRESHIDSAGCAHAVTDNAPPGIYGVRWQW